MIVHELFVEVIG